MRVHCYVVEHDKGFAPNPFWGVCTLACCKPRIRAKATVGDIILGFGSADKRVKLGGRVIYWMKVDEIISFNEYWHDSRFIQKKPELGGSLMACYGDNIYHSVDGVWQQASSFHSDGEGLGRGNLRADTRTTDKVLIGHEFTYWGSKAPKLPPELTGLVPRGRAERCRYNDDEKKLIVDWIASRKDFGYRSPPADWLREHADTFAASHI